MNLVKISNHLFWQVFEDAIQSWERVSDADGVVQHKFWHELVIHTNQTQDLMLMVYVQSPQEMAEARMKRLDEELKVFFESEEAKKSQIISIYTKVTHMWVAASCLDCLACTEICYKEARNLWSQVQLIWKTLYLASTFQGGTVYNAVAATESDNECTVVDRNRS